MDFIYSYSTPIGLLWIGEFNNAISYISIHKPDGLINETKLIKQCYQELLEYFNGHRKEFSFPIYYKDTLFRETCYKALQTIPYGKTISYQELANKINKPSASRAVGNAIHHNPLLIVIPCHRIIRKNGDLGGFGAGIDIKIKLLELEGGIKI